VERVKKNIAQGAILPAGPWHHPGDPFQTAIAINAQRAACGERLVNAQEVLNLAMRPSMFVWAPEQIYRGTRVKCPTCGSTCSRQWWGDQRILHGISTQSVYVARRYACNSCQVRGQPGQARGLSTAGAKTFLADSGAALALLPASVRSALSFSDMGRVLCDAPLVDLLRSSATKLSWLSIAEIVNELKATAWTRDVVLPYLRLCDFLSIAPRSLPVALPSQYKISSEWLRNLYHYDFRTREQEVLQELEKEQGDAVLKFDWTKNAAARCRGNFLLNVMTGANKVLASVLTRTSAPYEVEHVLWQLHGRGMRPKVVYVDDECCGTWSATVKRVWPSCYVRLDALHALMRLTKTTVSTQHPWHGNFCGMLSEALFTYDQRVLRRIRKATARRGHSCALTKSQKYKYVPRVIQGTKEIADSIQEVLGKFRNREHGESGTLLTPSTDNAWANLRHHILRGCVCDPPGIDLNIYDETMALQIGGETFHPVRKLRGTSSLEGYHSHQKRWLGPRGTHTPDVGMALLTDGNLRWNRQRNNETLPEEEHAPPIFAHGLLQEERRLRRRLSSST